MTRPRVLIACEFSGTVREAFKATGCNAYSCDLLPTEISGQHIQGDMLEILQQPWDLVIAHPPCTYLANSGVSWLHKDPTRWDAMRNGAQFFSAMFEANSPRLAVENPIQHRYAKEAYGKGRQTQVIQPWMFGHPESKATCLWLRGLPPLTATDVVKDEMLQLSDSERQRLHYLPPSKDRWRERSRTYPGIAKAMAEQWTPLLGVPA